ncbi:MAG: phenylalanine--tRNA ligase subunit alpha [Nitrospirae bacterium]|nr:phenylalanine--tRNA ligase subunit alpha [Nitrospirota bacterium]
MDPSTLYDSLHPLEINILAIFTQSSTPLTDPQLGQEAQLEASQVSMAIGWLLAKELIHVKTETRTLFVTLTEVGQSYLDEASPPEWILRRITDNQDDRLTVQDLQAQGIFQPTELSRAIGLLKKEQAIRLISGGVVESTSTPSATTQAIRELLQNIHSATLELASFSSSHQIILRQFSVKRGNSHEPFRIEEHVAREYELTTSGQEIGQLCHRGPLEEISQLTPEMLKDGSWKNQRFRKYTINLRPPRLALGRRHPYREFLDLVKRKLASMGFQEMRGPLVETEFWNMDALFMPQFHPAREIHDVYFVKTPSHSETIPEPFLSRVAEAHEHGGSTGSSGWGYTYDKERARRLILRSQGTAVSARTLAAQPAVPGKYFSIARCFRYDQVDATHATDFIQVEGIVLGEDIHFRTLLGLLTLFAKEMAQAQESRFLPAYFPFTEPSVELHVRHPRLGWMELGGAGLLRPEVTHPLGVTVPVIAWGLGLDRMAMVALGIHDIRDLFTSDLEKVRNMRAQY